MEVKELRENWSYPKDGFICLSCGKHIREIIEKAEADRKVIYDERQEVLKKGLDGKALALEWKLNGIDWYRAHLLDSLLRDVEVE